MANLGDIGNAVGGLAWSATKATGRGALTATKWTAKVATRTALNQIYYNTGIAGAALKGVIDVSTDFASGKFNPKPKQKSFGGSSDSRDPGTFASAAKAVMASALNANEITQYQIKSNDVRQELENVNAHLTGLLRRFHRGMNDSYQRMGKAIDAQGAELRSIRSDLYNLTIATREMNADITRMRYEMAKQRNPNATGDGFGNLKHGDKEGAQASSGLAALMGELGWKGIAAGSVAGAAGLAATKKLFGLLKRFGGKIATKVAGRGALGALGPVGALIMAGWTAYDIYDYFYGGTDAGKAKDDNKTDGKAVSFKDVLSFSLTVHNDIDIVSKKEIIIKAPLITIDANRVIIKGKVEYLGAGEAAVKSMSDNVIDHTNQKPFTPRDKSMSDNVIDATGSPSGGGPSGGGSYSGGGGATTQPRNTPANAASKTSAGAAIQRPDSAGGSIIAVPGSPGGPAGPRGTKARTKEEAAQIIAKAKAGEIPASSAAVDAAITQLGMHEVKNREEIKQFLRDGGQRMDNGSDFDPATTAWCAAWVNSHMEQNGIKGLTGGDRFMAEAYTRWGQPVEGDPQKGDVMAKSGHVGMFTGESEMRGGVPYDKMISGNTTGGQSKNPDRVGYTWERRGKYQYRRAGENDYKEGYGPKSDGPKNFKPPMKLGVPTGAEAQQNEKPAWDNRTAGRGLDDSIFDRRGKFGEQLTPEMKNRIKAMAISEVGATNIAAQRAVIETMFNRADATGKSLDETINQKYYEPYQNGSFYRNQNKLAGDKDLDKAMDSRLDEVLNDSNDSNFATHNGSAGVAASARKTQTIGAELGGETFSRKDIAAYSREHGAGTVKKEGNWFKERKARAAALANQTPMPQQQADAPSRKMSRTQKFVDRAVKSRKKEVALNTKQPKAPSQPPPKNDKPEAKDPRGEQNTREVSFKRHNPEAMPRSPGSDGYAGGGDCPDGTSFCGI